ncbi:MULTISPECIES: hypothetical protein [Brucella/Ochrobactrum group]|jgi:hypothetical protein|uniref:Uncharacterized protein n=1 Tax=Brucella anthropi TaxID=529 RepID=A0A6L3Z5E3_BRUAN|nr:MULTISPECIES: hypothetical protein [Brucella/Ochrobactrum group]KAB2731589.1 hypothetical protein F9K89_23580 [Brucella anthropi]KAB2738567.1 hypothetical protein F9K90_07765 [Brucella anthropi]KAB2768604.1 hypothetical protein F9L04_13080 [Brucella anthropi]MBQ0707756.1 hypothetical protein [Ochrobactrum sp. AP1BH01-1]
MNDYPKDSAIRNDPTLIGQMAYEASLAACPQYQNGDPRPSWAQLSEAAQWSWSRSKQLP